MGPTGRNGWQQKREKQPEEKEISDLDLGSGDGTGCEKLRMNKQWKPTVPSEIPPVMKQQTNRPKTTKTSSEILPVQVMRQPRVQQTRSDQRDLAGFLPDLGEKESEYSKHYRTGAQERSDRGAARREKQEREERERVRKQQEEIEEKARMEAEKERGNQIVNDALLKEEEEEAKTAIGGNMQNRRHRKKAKPTTSTKTDEERKRKKRRISEDDEEDDL